MAQLGRIPEAGDSVEIDGGVLEVAEVDERRVKTVRFIVAEPAEPASESSLEEPEES